MAHLGCISNSEAALDCFFFFFLPYDPIPFPISLAHDRASGWICYVIPFKKSDWSFCPSSPATRLHPSRTSAATQSGAKQHLMRLFGEKKKNQIHNSV